MTAGSNGVKLGGGHRKNDPIVRKAALLFMWASVIALSALVLTLAYVACRAIIG